MTPSSPLQNEQAGLGKANPSLLRRVMVAALVVVGLLIGLAFVRVGIQGWTIYQSGKRIEAALQSGLSASSLPLLQDELQQISETVSIVNRQAKPSRPILALLDGVTIYGGTLAAAPDLLNAGSKMLTLASDAANLLFPLLAASGDELGLETVIAALADADLAALTPQAEEASALLTAIATDSLHPAIAEPLRDVQSMASLLPAGMKLAPRMSQLLGYDGAKSYLVLIQNNFELRATGGFISAVGLMTIENGELGELDVKDSYHIYQAGAEYPPAPEPMQTFMNIPIMLFRDVNWSPDLPTSAQLARSFYLRDTGNEINGIVTIDLHAVEKLVGAVGPLHLPGVEEAITDQNIIDFIKEVWVDPLDTDDVASEEVSGAWWSKRKDFMPALAVAALQRIKEGDIDAVALVKAGLSALDGRSIQVWLADLQATEVLAGLGWDGSLVPTEGADFLALVDTNMGYNKVNAVVEESLQYDVTWSGEGNGPAVATAAITYRHPVEKTNHVCDQTPRYGDSYDDMIARCYFDYVRLYVPSGSQLLNAEGFELDSVTSKRGENGTQVFAGWFVLPPGEAHTVSFTYELPATLNEEEYRLAVLRQSGAEPLRLNARIGDEEFETIIERGRFEWQAD